MPSPRRTWKVDTIASDTDPTRTGHHLLLPQPALPDGRFPAGWLDWQTVTFRRVSLRPDPAPVEFSGDSTVVFTLDPSQALPAGTTFSWVLRTSDGRDSVATAAPTHTRELKAGTQGKLLIMAHQAGTKRVIARDSVPISSAEPKPFWRIDTIQDQDDLFELADGAPLAVLFNRILAAPNSGLIAIDDEGGGRTVLRLRVLPTALWDATRCCPPPASATGELRQTLGIMPEESFEVGPLFAGWGTNRWSQSTGDLATGTMTGQFVDGLTEDNVKGAGTQAGPMGVLRIEATRNGATMTGTISVTGWFSDTDGEQFVDPDPASFRFPFTATRMDAIPAPAVKAAAARKR